MYIVPELGFADIVMVDARAPGTKAKLIAVNSIAVVKRRLIFVIVFSRITQ